jgi:hypothetical protein
LLVERMPRRKADARVAYGDGGLAGGKVRVGKGVEMVGVVEVVADRYDRRGGAWGTFVEGEKGTRDV